MRGRKFIWKAAVAVYSAMFVSSCNDGNNDPLVKSIRAMKVGETVPIAGLIPPVDRFCILYPMQDRLRRDDPDRERVNRLIEHDRISINEGSWHMLFIKPEAVSVSTFKRSAELDILSPSETVMIRHLLPTNFNPTACAPAAAARMHKLRFNGRTYVLLGETHEHL